jgi:Zn-dependent protease
MLVAAIANRFTPLSLAALAAWILCVTLHEFAHALVAFWGGDDSVRHRGYLTLDPTKFIHPVNTILIPAIVLLMGGFPLPGAAVPIDESRLRSQKWAAYVSAAGPIANFLLFLLLCVPLHPRLGLVDPLQERQPMWVYFLGTMAVLNLFSTLFNLIPLPPLDGFGIIEGSLDRETRWKLRQPQVGFGCLAVLYMILWNVPQTMLPFYWMLDTVTRALGLDGLLMLRGYFIIFQGGT